MTRKETLLSLLCLFAVGTAVMMIQVGNTHLWDQDEGFYATTAAEMYARNDWITPTFNGQLFAHKPPMMFWGMMAGYSAFGVSEFGARCFSTLFGLGTIFLTYAIARRLFDATTGLFSGLAIGSCVMFTMVARSATADAHLTFFVALALYLWVIDYFPAIISNRDQSFASVRWRTWIATYAVMGLAVLTKGPIGFLFPTAVIGLFLLTEKTNFLSTANSLPQKLWALLKPYSPISFVETVWKMRPLTAAVVVLLVAAPWYLLVQWRTDGKFMQEFIGVHHLGRMSQVMDNHSGPVYYYFLACLIGMYPWSAFAIPTTLNWFNQFRVLERSRAVRFVSCWVGVYLVIFSLASTKLPNYVLPAYPALAIIIGRYFAMWTQNVSSVSKAWLTAGWLLLIAFGLLIVAGVPISGWIEFGGQNILDRVAIDRETQGRLMWLGVAGVPLALFGTIGVAFLWSHRPRLAGGAFSAAAVSMMVILCQFVAPELDRFQTPQRLAERWRTQTKSSDSQVAILGYFRPTMVFYFGRDLNFFSSADEAIEFSKRSGATLLVTTETQYATIRHQLPASTEIIERVSQFPDRGDVLVLGNKSLLR